jgi:hypothetical protein
MFRRGTPPSPTAPSSRLGLLLQTGAQEASATLLGRDYSAPNGEAFVAFTFVAGYNTIPRSAGLAEIENGFPDWKALDSHEAATRVIQVAAGLGTLALTDDPANLGFISSGLQGAQGPEAVRALWRYFLDTVFSGARTSSMDQLGKLYAEGDADGLVIPVLDALRSAAGFGPSSDPHQECAAWMEWLADTVPAIHHNYWAMVESMGERLRSRDIRLAKMSMKDGWEPKV